APPPSADTAPPVDVASSGDAAGGPAPAGTPSPDGGATTGPTPPADTGTPSGGTPPETMPNVLAAPNAGLAPHGAAAPSAPPPSDAAPAPEPPPGPVAAREPGPPEPAAPTPPDAAATPSPAASAPEPMSAEAVGDRLAALGEDASARAALDAVFASWHTERLAPAEPGEPGRFADTAARRGLQEIVISTNGTLLRALDLPAILELRARDGSTRYVATTALSDDAATLIVDGRPVAVARDALDRSWKGRAHVFWRDFDEIGPTIGPASGADAVRRLQALLHRAGVYSGPESGRYDAATRVAVTQFQRARHMVADGLA